MTKEELSRLIKGCIVYYVRFIPKCGVSEILELHVVKIKDNYFIGADRKTKQSMLVTEDNYEKLVFDDRDDALKQLKKIEKEMHYKKKKFVVELEED